MILKPLRLSRLLSQEQLAEMAGLSVRTIQRIESGHKPSLESLKCLASVLEVDVSTLTQETFMIDKKSDSWKQLPAGIKWYFLLNGGRMPAPGFFWPSRKSLVGIELRAHFFGFIFFAFAFVVIAKPQFFEGVTSMGAPALAGGLTMLYTAYFVRLHIWLCDRYGLWHDDLDAAHAQQRDVAAL